MSGKFFDKYPYTDFHELNLDWILDTVKKSEKKIDDFTIFNALTWAGVWDAGKSYVKWSIVQDSDGNGYISTRAVPANVDIKNTDYWQPIAKYSDLYAAFNQRISKLENNFFDTTVDMLDADLEVGNFVKTAGYYKINDFGGGDFVIIPANNTNPSKNFNLYRGLIPFASNKSALLIPSFPYNPRQFGLKDTDDLGAFIAEILNAGKDNFYLPPGNYTWSSHIALKDRNGVTIEGPSAASYYSNATLQSIYNSANIQFKNLLGKNALALLGCNRVSLKNLYFYGDKNNSPDVALFIGRSVNNNSANFNNFYNIGISITNRSEANNGNGTIGIYNLGGEEAEYNNCYIEADNGICLMRRDSINIASIVPEYSFTASQITMTVVSISNPHMVIKNNAFILDTVSSIFIDGAFIAGDRQSDTTIFNLRFGKTYLNGLKSYLRQLIANVEVEQVGASIPFNVTYIDPDVDPKLIGCDINMFISGSDNSRKWFTNNSGHKIYVDTSKFNLNSDITKNTFDDNFNFVQCEFSGSVNRVSSIENQHNNIVNNFLNSGLVYSGVLTNQYNTHEKMLDKIYTLLEDGYTGITFSVQVQGVGNYYGIMLRTIGSYNGFLVSASNLYTFSKSDGTFTETAFK